MAKKNKLAPFKRIVIIAIVLAVVQLGIILYLQLGKAPKLTERERVETASQRITDIDDRRRVQLKIQLAVSDFMLANNNEPPKDLKQLVPTYFDQVPIDPSTKQPFEYKVEGKKFYVGGSTSAGEKQPSKKGGNDQSKTPQDPNAISEEEKALLISMLNKTDRVDKFVYNPSDRKDPFRPFDFAPDLEPDGDRSPLERYDITKYRMTAILDVTGEPSAMVEDPSGRGYTVKVGSKVGLRGGSVVEILADRVVVTETETDFAGEAKTRSIDIPMKGPSPKE